MALSWAKTVPAQGPRDCRGHDCTALWATHTPPLSSGKGSDFSGLYSLLTLLLSLLWTPLQSRVLSLSTLILVK